MADEKAAALPPIAKAEVLTEAPKAEVIKSETGAPLAPTPAAAPDERVLLMQRADMLGVIYHDTIDTQSLRERIKAKLADNKPVESPVLTGNALAAQRLQKAYENGMKLRRIRLICMNPSKADLPGEIFTFANKSLGTVRKFVPYTDTPDGYHVPEVIYQMLKEKTYLQVKTKKGAGGMDVPDTRWVKEFSIEDMEPLNAAQLQNLANQQAAAAGMPN